MNRLGRHQPPFGVTCYRQVRRLKEPAPERITARLAAEILNNYRSDKLAALSMAHRKALEARAIRGGYVKKAYNTMGREWWVNKFTGKRYR